MTELIRYGAIIGLFLAIFLILRGINPVYSLFFGAIIGAFIGGANLVQTVTILTDGTQSIMGTVIRVLAAGILAGVMMESGAAETIAQAVVKKLGEKKALLALALATGIITASGVFIPVAVLIVAPIALSVGNKMGISRLALLLALSGGGKAGNIISPNPNTIAVANGFNLSLSDVMIAGDKVTDQEVIALQKNDTEQKNNNPSLGKAVVAPVTAILLLMINPIGNIFHIETLANLKLDALYVLPVAGIIGMLAMGQHRNIAMYTKSGIEKMTPTVLILVGAGAIAGLIGASNLATQVINIIGSIGISGYYLSSPISGVLMAAATASTSTGVILATGTFGSTITDMGIPAISAAVMMHTGATVIDSLPQGNYFHVTGGSMNMTIKQRMKLIPYEAMVGGTMTLVATIFYQFIM